MRSLVITAALAAGVAGAWVAPAFAQPAVGEVVVTARYQGKELRTLAVPVSYRDLDLTTEAGRETLKQRVKATAQDACHRLGEANMGGTYAQPSCEQDAINSATQQEQLAFAQAKPRDTAVAIAAPTAPSAEETAKPSAAIEPTSLTNGPVPDTMENRKRYGGPTSNAGRRTKAKGN